METGECHPARASPGICSLGEGPCTRVHACHLVRVRTRSHTHSRCARQAVSAHGMRHVGRRALDLGPAVFRGWRTSICFFCLCLDNQYISSSCNCRLFRRVRVLRATRLAQLHGRLCLDSSSNGRGMGCATGSEGRDMSET